MSSPSVSGRLRRRVDRLDGGDARDVASMTDAQLLRVIARQMSDPLGFLAMPEETQNRLLEETSREGVRNRVE